MAKFNDNKYVPLMYTLKKMMKLMFYFNSLYSQSFFELRIVIIIRKGATLQ